MTDVVIPLHLSEILPVRVAVLRKDTPVDHCNYPEDNYPDVIHLGIMRNNTVVATSTWFTKECPEQLGVPALQLKGMAVAEALQGAGLGSLLIEAGISIARDRGAHIVWARARDSAMGFYERLHFVSTGEGFIDGPTAMLHHIVIRAF
jgi:GNAT superfamily N-acetyltransferase